MTSFQRPMSFQPGAAPDDPLERKKLAQKVRLEKRLGMAQFHQAYKSGNLEGQRVAGQNLIDINATGESLARANAAPLASEPRQLPGGGMETPEQVTARMQGNRDILRVKGKMAVANSARQDTAALDAQPDPALAAGSRLPGAPTKPMADYRDETRRRDILRFAGTAPVVGPNDAVGAATLTTPAAMEAAQRTTAAKAIADRYDQQVAGLDQRLGQFTPEEIAASRAAARMAPRDRLRAQGRVDQAMKVYQTQQGETYNTADAAAKTGQNLANTVRDTTGRAAFDAATAVSPQVTQPTAEAAGATARANALAAKTGEVTQQGALTEAQSPETAARAEMIRQAALRRAQNDNAAAGREGAPDLVSAQEGLTRAEIAAKTKVAQAGGRQADLVEPSTGANPALQQAKAYSDVLSAFVPDPVAHEADIRNSAAVLHQAVGSIVPGFSGLVTIDPNSPAAQAITKLVSDANTVLPAMYSASPRAAAEYARQMLLAIPESGYQFHGGRGFNETTIGRTLTGRGGPVAALIGEAVDRPDVAYRQQAADRLNSLRDLLSAVASGKPPTPIQ